PHAVPLITFARTVSIAQNKDIVTLQLGKKCFNGDKCSWTTNDSKIIKHRQVNKKLGTEQLGTTPLRNIQTTTIGSSTKILPMISVIGFMEMWKYATTLCQDYT